MSEQVNPNGVAQAREAKGLLVAGQPNASKLLDWSEMMILHLIKARYVKDYKIEVWFNDGQHGIVDLGHPDFFNGPVFQELVDQEKFSAFIVDPELNTIMWENGADIAPEYLANQIVEQVP